MIQVIADTTYNAPIKGMHPVMRLIYKSGHRLTTQIK